MTTNPDPSPAAPRQGWLQGFLERARHLAIRGFHAYASWLTRQSWWRFTLFSILLLIITAILSELPPFSWKFEPWPTAQSKSHAVPTERASPKTRAIAPKLPKPPTPPAASNGVPSAKGPSQVRNNLGEALLTLQIQDPSKTDSLEEKQALKEVHRALEEIHAQLKDAEIPPGLIQIETSDSDSDSDSKDEDVDEDVCEDEGEDEGETLGDHLPNLALLIIFVSIPLKIAYQGQQRAQAMAVQAVQTAETEALRRQVTEARLAAMRAQIEPHFLFNTLGSIEHLIETDPARAGRMQRSLIAFLREAMPMLRETQSDMFRDLGRELAIVTPYLELLKMRMEERLRAEIRIPAGLMSAEFPPMMLQSLVENAIRHGLEPRPEGGLITLDAAVVDGRLTVSVSDTGVGFGHSNHPGGGVGLTNIRERLRLLYGDRASLRTVSPASGGSVVSIEIPYRSQTVPSVPPVAMPTTNPDHDKPIA
jgi:hypothetical protein